MNCTERPLSATGNDRGMFDWTVEQRNVLSEESLPMHYGVLIRYWWEIGIQKLRKDFKSYILNNLKWISEDILSLMSSTFVSNRCPQPGWGYPSSGEQNCYNYCQSTKAWNMTYLEECICKCIEGSRKFFSAKTYFRVNIIHCNSE